MGFQETEMKQMVRNVLMSSDTQKIKIFAVSGQTLAASFYQMLSARISLFDSVKFKFVPTMQGKAEYSSSDNAMSLGFTSIKSDANRGMIIHEATHAVCDMLGMSLTIADSEVMAYVAQCQFMLANSGNYRLEGSNKTKDAIFADAWNVAEKIQNGQIPSEKDYSTVRQAVCADSEYGEKSLSKAAAFNGL